MTVVDVPPYVVDFLREHQILTLATASASGLPHAATVIYASDGLALYYCVSPGTLTARNIEENAQVAFAIDEYCADWSKVQGIQGHGESRVLLDPQQIRQAASLFEEKFPFLAHAAASAESPFNHRAFYRVAPSEVHFVDNPGSDGTPAWMQFRRSVVYSVFRALPQHQVEGLAARLQSIHVNPGEIVVRQGGPADKFFIIVDGEVEVLHTEAGEERRVASLKSGQFFGEIAILRDRPRTATVKAVSAVTLLAMDRDTFQSLVAQALATTQDFDRIIQQRLDAGTASE